MIQPLNVVKSLGIFVFVATLMFPFIATGQTSPFSGRQIDLSGGAAHEHETGHSGLSSEIASATSDARSALETYSALIEKLEGYLAARNYEKALAASRYINRVAPAMTKRMSAGSIDPGVARALQQRLAAVDEKLGGMAASRLVSTARGFNGYSTRSGPGGGNVACAWLVSAILRAAGLVPAGWHDNVANDLVARLVREFGWSKIPPGGREYSGSVSSSQMLPGDVVFWSPSEHVGVYLGNGMVLSNSSGQARGCIHPVSGYYDGWIPRFVVRPPSA